MKYYLVSVIDILDLGSNPIPQKNDKEEISFKPIKHLRQYKKKEDAQKALKEVAVELVEKNGGERQVQYALTDSALTNIAKSQTTIYPLGFYIKEDKNVVKIYEKYIEAGWLMSSKSIQLVKVLCVTEITLDVNFNLKCDEDSLHHSIFRAPNIAGVAYMDELKEALKKRNLKKKQKQEELLKKQELEKQKYVENDSDVSNDDDNIPTPPPFTEDDMVVKIEETVEEVFIDNQNIYIE